jgi:hypothetical protein
MNDGQVPTVVTSSDHDNQSGTEAAADQITLGPDRLQHTTTRTRDRLRRLLEPALIIASTGVILLAVHATGGEDPPAAAPPTAPSPSQVARAEVAAPRHADLRLVAPQTAAPGERITVLAYRNRRLCGPAELRLDSKPVPHQLLAYAGTPNPDYAEMFMMIDVPRSAHPGNHVIELYGPRQGGPAGPLCGDVREHQARLASTTITINGTNHRP